jgi:hypothetical protein
VFTAGVQEAVDLRADPAEAEMPKSPIQEVLYGELGHGEIVRAEPGERQAGDRVPQVHDGHVGGQYGLGHPSAVDPRQDPVTLPIP